MTSSSSSDLSYSSGTKNEPQLILLDHGLYKTLDTELRANYAGLWKVGHNLVVSPSFDFFHIPRVLQHIIHQVRRAQDLQSTLFGPALVLQITMLLTTMPIIKWASWSTSRSNSLFLEREALKSLKTAPSNPIAQSQLSNVMTPRVGLWLCLTKINHQKACYSGMRLPYWQ